MQNNKIVKLTTINVLEGDKAQQAFNNIMKEDVAIRSHELLNRNTKYELDYNTILTRHGLYLVTFDYEGERVSMLEEITNFDYMEFC